MKKGTPTFKYWKASFDEYVYGQLYFEAEALVVAETKEAALGLLLEEYPDAKVPEKWHLEELVIPNKQAIIGFHQRWG